MSGDYLMNIPYLLKLLKMNKPILLAVLLAGLTISNEADAQLTGIAINDNGAKADTSAILDVNLNVTTPKRGVFCCLA